MNLNVFGKKCKTSDGKEFLNYFTALKKKDGTEQTVKVKFRSECGTPKSNPATIEVGRGHCNLTTDQYIDSETGDLRKSYILWVTSFVEKEYIDHSLDDYDFD